MTLAIEIFILLLAVLGVVLIVWTDNIIHAAYALALVLLMVAAMYVLLHAELLAVTQIMLYAGGIVILLAFGVMMTNRLRGEKVLSGVHNRFLALLIAVCSFLSLVWLINKTNLPPVKNPTPATNQIEAIGLLFLTEHLVAFELIAFILLVVLVGVVYLAKMSAQDE